jgi:hypothetical protein
VLTPLGLNGQLAEPVGLEAKPEQEQLPLKRAVMGLLVVPLASLKIVPLASTTIVLDTTPLETVFVPPT